MKAYQEFIKHRENRKYICILIIVIIALFCAALGYARHNKKTVLTLGVFAGNNWDVPDSSSYQLIDNAIEKFEKEHEGVEVKYTGGIQIDDYSQWLSAAIVRGDAPDVFFILSDDFSLFSSIGALKDLDMLIEQDEDFSESAYYCAAYEFGQLDENQYALPFESVPNMMFVNKTLLQENGIEVPDEDWTWDDFYEICKAVTKDTDGNGVLDQFGVYNYTWKEAFRTNNVELFDQSGSICQLGNSNVEQSVQFLKKMYNLNEGYQVTSNDFDMGRVAFRPVFLAEYRTYKPYPWSIKKYSNFDWDCITLPRGPEGDNVSELQTTLMGINVRTAHTKLAWELLKTFTYDEEIQMQIFQYQVGSSVLKKVTSSDEAMQLINADAPEGSEVNAQMISEIMEKAQPELSIRKLDQVESKLDDGINKIIQEKKNQEVSLVILQREINNELDD